MSQGSLLDMQGGSKLHISIEATHATRTGAFLLVASQIFLKPVYVWIKLLLAAGFTSSQCGLFTGFALCGSIAEPAVVSEDRNDSLNSLARSNPMIDFCSTTVMKGSDEALAIYGKRPLNLMCIEKL